MKNSFFRLAYASIVLLFLLILILSTITFFWLIYWIFTGKSIYNDVFVLVDAAKNLLPD